MGPDIVELALDEVSDIGIRVVLVAEKDFLRDVAVLPKEAVDSGVGSAHDDDEERERFVGGGMMKGG